MESATLTMLFELQRRGIALAVREEDLLEELVRELTPILMVCDSCDGYLHLQEYPQQRFERGEIVVVGDRYPPTYIFETMTFAHALAFDPDRDMVVIHLARQDLLPPGFGDDTIAFREPARTRDWRDRERGYGPPPRKLGREGYRPRNYRGPGGFRRG